MSKSPAAKPAQNKAKGHTPEAIQKKLVLTGADIVQLGPEAELLVGGKNYNTALISQIEGIQAPYFRAISSLAFHQLLDETKVNGRVVRSVVDREYGRIDWNDPEINQDPDFLQKFVRQLGKQIYQAAKAEGELNVIADSINKVQEVASDDVPPTANPVPLEAYLRPDVAETPLTQEEALAGGPKTEAGMFVAPRILGSEE